jgi:alpha-L-fucosidase 2
MEVDIRKIVSRSDLKIQGTVRRAEGGLPIGNGTMGTLVWTSPVSLKTQINRVDVFASDSTSNSFNERHADYGYACAFADICFAGYSQDVFDETTTQTLRLYDAFGSIEGNGVKAEFFACEGRDVLAFRLNDQRETPEGITVLLRFLRPAEVRTRSHLACSAFELKPDAAILRQEFTEERFYCASAVAVTVSDNDFVLRYDNESGGRHDGIEGRAHILLGQEQETAVRICLKPKKGVSCVYISSAAAMDRESDVSAAACALARDAAKEGFDALRAMHEPFWAQYWNRSFVELSGDAEAELVQTHYQYFYYLMACCARGSYPFNFGGMLFSPRGDLRHWGAMQWYANLSLYHNPVCASGRFELDAPYFAQLNRNYEKYAIAAKQQWDSEGIFIPEVCGFDGPEILPDTIAAELKDLFLVRKSFDESSDAFRAFAYGKRPHESRWNFKHYEKWEKGVLQVSNRGAGIFNFTTHMMGSQVGYAYEYWKYYRYTGDLEHLRTKGYPIIRGVAEFFRTFPNLRQGEDGLLHVYHTNSSEGFFNSTDSMESLCTIRGILKIAQAAARALNTDAPLCRRWQQVLSHLAPLPQTDNPKITAPIPQTEKPIWVGAVCDFHIDERSRLRPNMTPAMFCEQWNSATAQTDPQMYQTGLETFDYLKANNAPDSRAFAFEMSRMASIAAFAGDGQLVRQILCAQLQAVNASAEYCYYENNGSVPVFENRLTAREGVNAISAERLGNAADGLQNALLQSCGGAPDQPGLLRICPAMPVQWSARFRLYAMGGFIVEAQCEKGRARKVVIISQNGEPLRLVNPFDGPFLLERGQKAETIHTAQWAGETSKGEKLILTAL